MKYCKFCGKEIDDAKFCPHCGKQQHTETPKTAGGRRLHCPHCRGEQLIAVTETGEATGYATHGRVTRNIGTTTYHTTTVNRHYWMCQECGHKFRNLEDLEKELVTETKRAKGCKIAAVVFGVVFLLFVLSMMANEVGMVLFLLPTAMMFVCTLLFFATWFTSKKKVEQMTAEKAYLEQNCFG